MTPGTTGGGGRAFPTPYAGTFCCPNSGFRLILGSRTRLNFPTHALLFLAFPRFCLDALIIDGSPIDRGTLILRHAS